MGIQCGRACCRFCAVCLSNFGYVTEYTFVCLTHNEANQYQNVGVWRRERFIVGPGKEMGGSCLPKLGTPQGFQQSIIKARSGRGFTGYVVNMGTVLQLVDIEVTGWLK